MHLTSLLFVLPCTLLSLCSIAQKKKKDVLINKVVYKYGDIKPEDFKSTIYPIDSSATAVVIADVGNSQFIGNSDGGFSIEFKEQKRVRLLNKNSFNNEATITLSLYYDGADEERLTEFEAVTYNVEGGKVVANKLNKADLFTDKYNDHYKLYKFTFPNVKEGSIIEYKYTTLSPYIMMLHPWKFQKDIPVLWSEYQTTIPSSIYDYLIIKRGFLPFVIDTTYYSRKNYYVTFKQGMYGTYNSGYNAETVMGHWAMKDIPPLKEEPFTACLEDYRSKISFQLRHIVHPAYKEDVLGTWQQLADKLLQREDFGADLNKSNSWLNKDIEDAIKGKMTDYDKVKSIYEYVRDSYTCNASRGVFLTSTLKKVYQDKGGKVADINLLLTAAYRSAGFNACPAILSTRSHGRANEAMPLVEQYDYVICRVIFDNQSYLLDASQRYLGFGKLIPELYNHFIQLIDTMPKAIPLSPDSLKETNATTVFMINDKEHKLSASVSSMAGSVASQQLREKLSKQSRESYFKELKAFYTGEVEMANEAIDSLKLLNYPVKVSYNLQMNLKGDDLIYFNPIIGKEERKNPFTAAERHYPVDMPYCVDESYVFDMEIPEGYTVEELPKSTRVMLKEKEGMFEYMIAQSSGHIQMHTRVKLDKAIYSPEDYQTLRDFYAYIVKKEADQIVFRKVKQ